MRYRRVMRDANHAEIAKALEDAGCTVMDTAAAGRGAPDLVVGWHGVTYLLEIKSGSRARHVRKDEDHQREWRARWRGGPAFVVASVDEALRAVGVISALGSRS